MKQYLYISIISLATLACGHAKKAEPAAETAALGNVITLTDAQVKNAGIVTGKIEPREISSVLKLNGMIDVPPQNMVSISVPLGGYLQSTTLLPGMHVNKGDVIAVMEDQQYIQLQQDYLTAKARITLLENEYYRQKELNESKASSDKVFQQAEADYKTQKVLLSALAQKLQLAGINVSQLNENNISKSVNIHSPINGFVTKVNVNIGRYVSPTEVLFELVNPTDIHLALKVFEKDVDKLFIGQKVLAYTNNQPEKKYDCEVLLIGRDISPDRNTDVHCHFEAYDKTLIPGTYMNAEVQVKNKRAQVLPEDAVVRFENKNYVFTKQAANQFAFTEVHTGIAENGFVEVEDAENLANSEMVVKGAYSLLMSLKNKSEE